MKRRLLLSLLWGMFLFAPSFGHPACAPIRAFTGGAVSASETELAYGVVERRCLGKEARTRWLLWRVRGAGRPELLMEGNFPLEPIGWLGESIVLRKRNGGTAGYLFWDPAAPGVLAPVPELEGKEVLIRGSGAWFWGRDGEGWALWRWEPDHPSDGARPSGGARRTVRVLPGGGEAGVLADYWPSPRGSGKLVVLRREKCERVMLFPEKGEPMRLTEGCDGAPIRGQWSPDGTVLAVTVTGKNGAELRLYESAGKQVGTMSSKWEPVILSPWFMDDDPPRLGAVMAQTLYQVTGDRPGFHPIFAFPAPVTFVAPGERRVHLLVGMGVTDVEGVRGMTRMALYRIEDGVLRELP